MVDKATGRVVAVIALLILTATSLRGYLPGVERATRQKPPGNGSSLAYVVALLGVSLVIVAAALIARLRDPRRTPASAGGVPERISGGRGRPPWRVLLISSAVLVAWLLAVWLLSRFVVHPRAASLPAPPTSGAPTPTPTPGRPPEPRDVGAEGDVLGYLIASAVALIVLIVVGSTVAARRRRTAPLHIEAAQPLAPETSPDSSESLARAAEMGLAEIGDLSREPREAIIACYAAMERELAHVPGAVPQDFDTASEVLARAVEHHALHPDNASQLVNLFAEARFSPHVMNEGHRESAWHALRLVLAELRSVV